MKKRGAVQYSNLPSDIKPILHSPSLPVLTPPRHQEIEVENEYNVEEPNVPFGFHDPDFEEKGRTQHRLSQATESFRVKPTEMKSFIT